MSRAHQDTGIPFFFSGFWGDWTLHLLAWSLLLVFSGYEGWDWMYFSGKDGSLWIAVLYGHIFNAFLFYGNAFWLYPKFYREQRTLFWVLSMGLLLICQTMEMLIDGVFGSFLIRVHQPQAILVMAQGAYWQTFLFNLVFWGLGLAYHLPLELILKKRQHRVLQREKLQAELAFLRAQINPHSLFNGINSIYHLIDREPELAKETLLQLSELLRYQLYECQEMYIDLHKELLNLQHYISLEEIRKGEDAKITTTLPFTRDSWQVAPLLLIPLVENAFKHLSHYPSPEENQLDMVIQVIDQRLKMQLSNTFQESSTSPTQNSSGIGLQNVGRRLSLIYGKDHTLEISKENGRFQVALDIPLKKIK